MPASAVVSRKTVDPAVTEFWILGVRMVPETLEKLSLPELRTLTRKLLSAWEKLNSVSRKKIEPSASNPFYFALFAARIAWHMMPREERDVASWQESFRPFRLVELATELSAPNEPLPFLFFSKFDLSLIAGGKVTDRIWAEFQGATQTVIEGQNVYNQACAYSLRIAAAKLQPSREATSVRELEDLAIEALGRTLAEADTDRWRRVDPDLAYLRENARANTALRKMLIMSGVMAGSAPAAAPKG